VLNVENVGEGEKSGGKRKGKERRGKREGGKKEGKKREGADSCGRDIIYLIDATFDAMTGVEIRGHPVYHVLTDGSPSDDLIFALIIVLYKEGPLSFGWDYHVFQRW
jgi:hypothetical protein